MTVHVPMSSEVATEIHNNVDLPIATSEYVAGRFKEATGHKPTVIHNGVDHRLFHPRIPQKKARKCLKLPLDKKIIFWNASIIPRKDPMTLVKALPLIMEGIPESYLLIKGRAVNKSLLNEIKKQFRADGLLNSIRFDIGWIPYTLLPFYYRAADIYVHTSLMEGFSLSILEAMASGIPVIGSRVASIPEALDEKSLFPPRDYIQLANAVCEVLRNRDLREELSVRNRTKIFRRGFRWKDAAEKYLKQYEKLV